MPPAATLRAIVAAMAGAAHPWWIIGSTAVAAHKVATTVGDVDVLFDSGDADIVRGMGARLSAGSSDGRFRSALYGQWTGAGFPVDFMADLHLASASGWSPVRPITREMRSLKGVMLPVPNRVEMIDILTRFGRAKDHARVALLTA